MTSSFKPSFYHTLQHPLSYISLRIRKASFFFRISLLVFCKFYPSYSNLWTNKYQVFPKKQEEKQVFQKMPLEWPWKQNESVDRERAFGGFLTYLSMRFNYLDCVSLQIFFKQESIGRWCGEMLFSCKRQPKSQVKSK